MIVEEARHALAALLADRVEFGAPLARHTSLRVGGPADAMVVPADREELSRVLALCAAHGLPVSVLGAGFNVLVREGGIRGVVLRLKRLRRIERVADDAISVEAGASHATIIRYCIAQGLAGLEFGAGIPGTLGGWLTMNAGIGVREMKDVVREIEVFDREGRALPRIARAGLDFRYRSLEGLAPGAVLVAALLTVEPSSRTEVQSEIDRLLAKRQATQPTDVPSCGSVFRNPPGDYAGRLIETAGLKGAREGQAEISTVHANFIVNHGGATAGDILRLIERARETVARETGIELVPEVRLLGEESASAGGVL
ncbi:MAG: UDP-N-acetylenolpyruvoylglucosamine reductase [Deltaproteobacteria bacterium]|jgi:UDP-N-acetylmuramate dehydrogenase|nr:UDP-N-acetylenolpyruvoylglucosamine reductase [Deltaproteobacteria bacterium]